MRYCVKSDCMKKIASFRGLLLVAVSAVMLSGCDWVKEKLGMATSDDIERLRVEMEQKELRQRQIEDSIETARLDSLKKAQESGIPYAQLDKQYYVIMGSFKEVSNADILKAELEKIGYSPVRIELKNGFEMVALAGFNNYGEALKEIAKIERNDLCPYDVWVYSVSQSLHK